MQPQDGRLEADISALVLFEYAQANLPPDGHSGPVAEDQMRPRALALALSLVALGLASCGGLSYDSLDASEWLPDFHGEHGAIAFSAERFSAALTASHLTQDEANAAALQLCGDGCAIVLQFEGQGACGAIAAGSNRVIGVGSGSPREVADSAALAQCSDAGGAGCVVKLHACND